MGNYIKYKRFIKDFDNQELIQEFLDELITDGWEIIHYDEIPKTVTMLGVIVLAGKKRKEIL